MPRGRKAKVPNKPVSMEDEAMNAREREVQLKELKEEKDKLEKVVATQAEQLKEAKREADATEAVLQERNVEIKTLHDKVASQKETINKVTQLSNEKHAEIQNLERVQRSWKASFWYRVYDFFN